MLSLITTTPTNLKAITITIIMTTITIKPFIISIKKTYYYYFG